MMVYHPDRSARISSALEAILQSNNGYADIGLDVEVADAVQRAGFIVIRSTDLHGKPVFRGFTVQAQAALRSEPFGQSTYKPFTDRSNEPDYESWILARQDRTIAML